MPHLYAKEETKFAPSFPHTTTSYCTYKLGMQQCYHMHNFMHSSESGDFLWIALRAGFQVLFDQGKVPLNLLTIANFLFVCELMVGSVHLTLPARYKLSWDEEGAIPLSLALAMHVALPVRPSLMLNSS